jgi:cytosine/adenosine deaminase-related metal-dependent hydrolase
LEGRTGSLTPGKKADIVLIETRSLNVAPVHDPEAAVTLCADVSNVDTVIVNGVVKKRNGKLVGDIDRARRLVEASRDYLVEETARRKAAVAAAAAEPAAEPEAVSAAAEPAPAAAAEPAAG